MKSSPSLSLVALGRRQAARLRRTLWHTSLRAFWTTRPLTPAAAQAILRRVDPGAELRHRYRSETHQVFQATFRGLPAVAKFGGMDYDCKFLLRSEAERARSLYASGAPVPELLFGAEKRLRHPFFVSRDVGAVPRDQWTDEVYIRCMEFEASLIRRFGATVQAAGLPVMNPEASRESFFHMLRWTEAELRQGGILHREFQTALAAMQAEIDRYPWTLGALQPPHPLFDGQRFWAVDWDPPIYVPPLKWVCDCTYSLHVRKPKLAWQKAALLAEALELRLTGAELRAALAPWYRFKALEIGMFLLKKHRRWDYFRSLQHTFFGAVLADREQAATTLLRHSFAG